MTPVELLLEDQSQRFLPAPGIRKSGAPSEKLACSYTTDNINLIKLWSFPFSVAARKLRDSYVGSLCIENG